MSDPIKTTMIGGVEYTKGQVKTFNEDQHIYSDTHGNLKSKAIFNVELANGTKLKYSEQAPEREAKVVQNKNWTHIFGLQCAEITDTQASDGYALNGCDFCQVNASRWHMEGVIFKDKVGDDQDHIIIKHRVMDDGSVQVSENNIVRTNDGDLYHDETLGKYNNMNDRAD